MATELSPQHACRIASSAYDTLGSNTPLISAANELNESLGLFDVGNGIVFTGTTGPDVRSNFGYVAHATSGSRQGESVVSVRGTDLKVDWLTNFHMSTARTATGYPAHSGFNQLANSILPQLHSAFSGRNPNTIHVIGHSLGGATATLIADKLRDIADIKLYTFGAPRASYSIHVNYLVQRLGRGNVYRAYHDTDPVPMLPIFPYVHAPAGEKAYLMKGSGAVIAFGAHSLVEYQSHATDTWATLPVIDNRTFSLETVDDVLQAAGSLPGGFLNAQLMRLIVRALGLILSGVGVVAGLAALGAATILDQIAYAIMAGINVMSYGMDLAKRLVAQIMRFLGMAVNLSVDITTVFLRWLMQRLFGTIAQMAASALYRVV